MIKDQLFKRLLIPFAGICFPPITGLVNLRTATVSRLFLSALFFVAVVFFIWNGVVWITSRLRTTARLRSRIFLKFLMICVAAGLYAAALGLLSAFAWLQWSEESFDHRLLLRPTVCGGTGGLVLALLYETIFLSVEKELDSKVMQQLEKELREAEVNVLKNELDPHFFFNCMNALLHLVKEDSIKAQLFVHKLSNTYKYFLRNKDVDWVPLQEELAFLENYHYLLRIRFEDSIRIQNEIDSQTDGVCILPCTLQVLVENAIKHNFFSEKEPLVVTLAANNHFITVSNPVKPKLLAADSTKVGLRNLKARYRLTTNQNVLVQKGASRFLVKLPIIKKTNHDKSSDH